MLFPTVTFAVFFMLVLPLSWALMRQQTAWRVFILVASYVFYAWWDVSLVWLLALVSAIAYAGGMWIEFGVSPRRI